MWFCCSFATPTWSGRRRGMTKRREAVQLSRDQSFREFGTYGGQLEAAGAVPATDSLVDGPKADAGPGAAALAFVVDTAKRQRVVCGGWRSGRA